MPNSMFEDAGFTVPGKEKEKKAATPTSKAKTPSIFESAGFKIPGSEAAASAPAPTTERPQFADEIPIHAPGTPEFAEEQKKYPVNQQEPFENRFNAFRTAIDPTAAWPQNFQNALEGSAQRYQTGLENFREAPWTSAGHMAEGVLGVLTSPMAATTQTFVGDPVTQLTGNPKIGQDVAAGAGFMFPFRSVTGLPKTVGKSNALDQIVKTVGPENASEVAQRLARNPELSLMDVSDPVRQRAQGLAADPEQPMASNILTQEVRRRQTEAPAATNEAYTQAFGPTPNVPAILDQLKQHAIDVGKQQIEPAIANAKPANITPVLNAIDKEIGDSPVGRATLRAIKNGEEPAFPLSDYQERLFKLRNQITSGVGDPKAPKFLDVGGEQGLHKVQADLRAEAHNLQTSATGSDRNLGEKLMDIRNKMVDAADEASGGKYKPALKSYRDAKQIDEAFDAGFDTLKNRPGRAGLEDRPEMFAEWMKNAPQSERIARQLGTRLDIDQKINAVRNQTRAGENITAIPYNRAKLEMLFGKDEAGRLVNAMEDAQAKAQTNTQIIGGSKTAETLAGQKAMAVRKVGGGNPLSVLSPLAVEAAGMYMGAPGLGTAAYVGAKTAKLGAQAFGAAIDRQRNIAFAKAVSATGPERDQVLRSILSHPRVVREMKKSGNALMTTPNP